MKGRNKPNITYKYFVGRIGEDYLVFVKIEGM